MDKDRARACIEVMRTIARAHGVSVARVALAWLLHQQQVTSVIVGAERPEQLANNIAATQIALSPGEIQQINEVSVLPAEYLGWMFQRQGEYRRKQMGEGLAPRSLL